MQNFFLNLKINGEKKNKQNKRKRKKKIDEK